jgi:3-phosphoshikimate 1-carboxyvinyltransferase
MLRARGVSVRSERARVALEPPERIAPLDVRVPGDPSSAAFLVALALLGRDAEVVLPDVALNATRTGFLAAARAMGGAVEERDRSDEGGEPVGTLVARGSALRAIEIGGDEVPAMIDEIPVLVCLAARAEGTTTIRGAAELRVKESDRIATVVAGLRAIGADAEELPDGLVVTGSDRPLRGRVATAGDHRIAMAFGVLGALPGNAVEVDDPGCVAVSFPRFWDELRRLAGGAR